MNLVSTPKTRNPFKKQPLTSMTKEADSGKKSRFFPTTLILQLLLPKYKLFTLCKCISALGCLKQDSISSALRGPFIWGHFFSGLSLMHTESKSSLCLTQNKATFLVSDGLWEAAGSSWNTSGTKWPELSCTLALTWERWKPTCIHVFFCPWLLVLQAFHTVYMSFILGFQSNLSGAHLLSLFNVWHDVFRN